MPASSSRRFRPRLAGVIAQVDPDGAIDFESGWPARRGRLL